MFRSDTVDRRRNSRAPQGLDDVLHPRRTELPARYILIDASFTVSCVSAHLIVTLGGTTSGSQRCQTRRNRESNAQKASASAWCRSPCAMRHRSIFSIIRCTSDSTSVASGRISFRGSQISRWISSLRLCELECSDWRQGAPGRAWQLRQFQLGDKKEPGEIWPSESS
jgi:hypothetical protein